MRASELIGDLHGGSIVPFEQQEIFDGYEQRLIRWGCERCKSFEKRILSSGVISEELDAYIICRFNGEPIDLLHEATACPKRRRSSLHKNKSKSGRGRLYCVNSA